VFLTSQEALWAPPAGQNGHFAAANSSFVPSWACIAESVNATLVRSISENMFIYLLWRYCSSTSTLSDRPGLRAGRVRKHRFNKFQTRQILSIAASQQVGYRQRQHARWSCHVRNKGRIYIQSEYTQHRIIDTGSHLLNPVFSRRNRHGCCACLCSYSYAATSGRRPWRRT